MFGHHKVTNYFWKTVILRHLSKGGKLQLGIDDIGTEPAEVQDYGNFIYPIKELLAMRYDAQLFTVFTTNLEPKEIRQRYGDRIADRLNEMMTKVVYRNPTYRTENAQMADSQG